MRLSDALLILFRILLVPAFIGTTYLYLYPAVHGCGFPEIDSPHVNNGGSKVAPFRLLSLGDPQLEGDTSLPDPNDPLLPSLEGAWKERGLVETTRAVVEHDIPRLLHIVRKRLDLWGNDLYLAHIYRSLHWWTNPSHTVVLGDLLGSQWISDEEFERRRDRYWSTVFKKGEKVPSNITESRGRYETLGKDETWSRRVISVAGNHDIGYAGDITQERIDRFERAFGHANWDIYFTLEDGAASSLENEHSEAERKTAPALHLVILNSMNLDGPALTEHLRDDSMRFLFDNLKPHDSLQSPQTGTILLTHIPLHKPEGVCVDAPFFSFFREEHGGGIQEQNHLSEQTSASILEQLTGADFDRQALILNGHDHEGCDTWHQTSTAPSAFVGSEQGEEKPGWNSTRYDQTTNAADRGIREVTVRSMMGSFGGNAGLTSAWFDHEKGIWNFEYSTCALGVQHIWWAIHIFDLVVIIIGMIGTGVALIEKAWLGETRKVKTA